MNTQKIGTALGNLFSMHKCNQHGWTIPHPLQNTDAPLSHLLHALKWVRDYSYSPGMKIQIRCSQSVWLYFHGNMAVSRYSNFQEILKKKHQTIASDEDPINGAFYEKQQKGQLG